MASRIISLASASLLGFSASPPDVVRCVAKAGFTHCGLRVVTAIATPDNPMLPGKPLMRETRAALDGEGVTPFEIEVVRLDPGSRPAAFEGALETAGLLGAKHLIVICDDPDRGRLVANFAALCDLAASFGLTVNIEPTSYYTVDSVGKAKSVVRAAGKANGAVVPDPLHFFRAGDSLSDLHSLSDGFINFTQLCDGPARDMPSAEERMTEARTERLLPGQGQLDLRRYLAELDPSLPVSVEVMMAGLLEKSGPDEAARRIKEATTAFLAR